MNKRAYEIPYFPSCNAGIIHYFERIFTKNGPACYASGARNLYFPKCPIAAKGNANGIRKWPIAAKGNANGSRIFPQDRSFIGQDIL